MLIIGLLALWQGARRRHRLSEVGIPFSYELN